MSKEDLKQFLFKVEQLQELVDSLDRYPQRRNLLEACDTHDQVVRLAKSWGFVIDRRWGE